MSIDLDWTVLDRSLGEGLTELLNKQLQNANRPSFIGPIEVISLDFGTTPPDIEIIDIRDVYRDFAECDEQSDTEFREDTHLNNGASPNDSDEDFEWVSRRKALAATDPHGLTYHHLPPHLRYGRGPSTEFFNGISARMTQANCWQDGMVSHLNLHDLHLTSPHPHPVQSLQSKSPRSVDSGLPGTSEGQNITTPPTATNATLQSHHPDVQVHFRLEHQADLKLTLTTSMLINYPSPMFMSLPIKLSIIGLIFTGEIVLAYEGSKRRFHLSILDDLDPYGPVGDRHPKTPLPLTPNSSEASLSSRSAKPLPIGMRLLPSIVIESEIGQADKHVLKNVTRVERFIQDIIRKTVEEELVFPNFHTILLPNDS